MPESLYEDFRNESPSPGCEHATANETAPAYDPFADCYGGSETAVPFAETLDPRWFTLPIAEPGAMVIPADVALGRDFRMGSLPAIVLSLYGAEALPGEVNPEGNLGQVASPADDGKQARKTLVLVDSRRKLTGAATLKTAIAHCDELMGGWDRVVVLGWKFGPSFGKTITALDDARLEVLMIPPDLIGRLKRRPPA